MAYVSQQQETWFKKWAVSYLLFLYLMVLHFCRETFLTVLVLSTDKSLKVAVISYFEALSHSQNG
jgi:hypothetical protein